MSALVCLSFFLPPHDIKTLAGKTGLANACAGTEHMNADKVGQESTTRYVLQFGLRHVYVCASMCDRFLISFGLRSFPALTNTRKKNIKQNGFRSCLEGLAKESSADQYKRLALQLKNIDSLPISFS